MKTENSVVVPGEASGILSTPSPKNYLTQKGENMLTENLHDPIGSGGTMPGPHKKTDISTSDDKPGVGTNEDAVTSPPKKITMPGNSALDTASKIVVAPAASDSPPITSDFAVIPEEQARPNESPLPVDKVVVTPAPNPFDPANLRLKSGNLGVTLKKVYTSIPVKKRPGKQDYVRTRPSMEWQLVSVVVLEERTGHYYISDPELHDYLQVKLGFRALLKVAITRDGDLFLWVLKLPTTGAYYETWYQSALDIAVRAETKWVKLETEAENYNFTEGSGINVEPEWPDLSFAEILELAFKDRRIDSLDHPLLKRLRGEV